MLTRFQGILSVVRRSVHDWLGPRSAPRREPRSYALDPSTGETVYGDVPLRFRNLTLTEADVQAMDDPHEGAPGFKIRISKLAPGRRQAGALVEDRYSDRGYQVHGKARDPNLFTFIAYDEGHLVGTVAVRLDSPAGLSADQIYREEIDALRAQGSRLCEFTRLAVDKTSASQPVLAGLFHTAYLHAALLRGCTHAVIEVNPRHVLFYKRMLSFDVLGPERMNMRVKAPAVLLYVPFATIAAGLARFAGRHNDPQAGRSLFRFGFPPHEEAGVLRRLRDLAAEG